MDPTRRSVDPITFEILAHRPHQLEDLGGQARVLPYCEFELKKNDVLHIRTGCGGGYGDPLQQNPESVLNDVVNGLVSKGAANEIYGVVLNGPSDQLDLPATEQLRTHLRVERLRGL